ncbi:MAG: hypothetical protein ACR2RA_00985 [Geminicoccaceae bacterium]
MSEVFCAMIAVRSIAVAITLLAGLSLAAPLQAQTATLNVSARVIAECTVGSRRELARLARRLNDPSLIRRCSKGVVSRVDRRVVKVAKLKTRPAQSRRVSRKRSPRRTLAGETDVVLFTVTY